MTGLWLRDNLEPLLSKIFELLHYIKASITKQNMVVCSCALPKKMLQGLKLLTLAKKIIAST
jgi:hypothetical protein